MRDKVGIKTRIEADQQAPKHKDQIADRHNIMLQTSEVATAALPTKRSISTKREVRYGRIDVTQIMQDPTISQDSQPTVLTM
jgi:hypothetical protein